MNIAVIGAGMAGITAAQECLRLGASVTVFEKSRGIGGRMSHKRLPWCKVDIGAQYFTARDPRFLAHVRLWQQLKLVDAWQFTPMIVKDESLQPSPDTVCRYIGTPSMNTVLHELSVGLDFKLNTRVEALVQSESTNQWGVKTDSGRVFSGFDRVFVSLPAEQSYQLLSMYPIAKSIPSVMHEPCWALVLATKGEVSDSIQGVFGDNLVSWVSRMSNRIGAKTSVDYDDLWVLHFAGEWSELQGRGETDITRTGFEWLQSKLHLSLELVHSYEHFWRYAKLFASSPPLDPIVDANNNMAVIGDWCAGGRVEGAYISAIEAVDTIFGRRDK